MRTSFLFLLGIFATLSVFSQISYPFIKVDQFGYLPNAQKIAVLSDPKQGYNTAYAYTFGSTLEVVDATNQNVVFSGSPVLWNNGATHTQSGDKVAWFDFSSITTPGTYFIRDVQAGKESYTFKIEKCIYKEPLKRALRALYYQRCGMDKAAPFAETGWTDTHCHIGNLQDTDCRLYNNAVASTSKDLHGGWHDAGDYNKYVNFTFSPLVQLLLAYEDNPTIWGDDLGIPESGNQLPDILDEAKWELDWLLRMQQNGGSVLSVVGVQNFASASPPSADNAQRLYGPATTSASFTAAAVFALGAIQFQAIGQTAYANTLQTAATNAWNWATANPNITFYNTGVIAAGENETDGYGTFSRQIAAAVFLYKLTNNATYKDYVENNYNNVHLLQWSYAYPFEPVPQNVMLYYANLSGVNGTVASNILSAYSSSMQTNNADNLPAYLNQTDAYRAYMADNNYTWGNNEFKCHQGIMFNLMNRYNLDATNQNNYTEAGAGFLHYLHGVNPMGYTYLTNMGQFGAENSITSIYHGWFMDGSALWDKVGVSIYGPAPGFLPAGANPSYALDGCCTNNSCGSAAANALCDAALVTPPLGQPIQKSYADFNTNWPQNSWTVSEVGIYVQAAYVRLASQFYYATCNISSAVENNFQQHFDLYPNPASEMLTLHFKSEIKTILHYEIQTIEGKNLVSQTFSPQNETINISVAQLSKGFYLLKVSDGTGNFWVNKFCKQ